MTWDELNKKYEKSDAALTRKSLGGGSLDENWKKLMESTDKLLWLFIISNENRKERVKTAAD